MGGSGREREIERRERSKENEGMFSLSLTERQSLCVLRLWTINGRLVEKIENEAEIISLCYTSAPEGVYINVLIGGLANGKIRFWSSWNLALLCELPSPSSLSSPVLRYVGCNLTPCYKTLSTVDSPTVRFCHWCMIKIALFYIFDRIQK